MLTFIIFKTVIDMGYIEEESYNQTKRKFSKDIDNENAYLKQSKVDPFSSSVHSQSIPRPYSFQTRQGARK